ncbi:MAG TPA: phosphoenolpyruvate mutase [Candidatus Angelobacter sp.]|nr:phosphoenolpyruvate mutase [Candidatus Angelobacter sp.]
MNKYMGITQANISKASVLRALFNSSHTIRTMGSHNGLSAKLVEKNGFDAIWASSLEISTSYGLPDASILSMTDFLMATQAMYDAVEIPIIADCDSGFGDEANVAYMVRKYEASGIAAVCIEDKPFPKTNSFIAGHQKLVPTEVFADKIKAGCDARKSQDFVFIARIEALIAGMGMQEALDRADAYTEAGADAILIHSKKRTPDEVLEFTRLWKQRTPVIVVPTTYYKLTVDDAAKAGIKMLIYANHGIRSAVRAMDQAMASIMQNGCSTSVETSIATMDELFVLQGMEKVRKPIVEETPEIPLVLGKTKELRTRTIRAN